MTPPVIAEAQARLKAACTLPTRALGLGQFTVRTNAAGLVELVDPRGHPCGVFANEQIAEATRAVLSR